MAEHANLRSAIEQDVLVSPTRHATHILACRPFWKNWIRQAGLPDAAANQPPLPLCRKGPRCRNPNHAPLLTNLHDGRFFDRRPDLHLLQLSAL